MQKRPETVKEVCITCVTVSESMECAYFRAADMYIQF